MKNNEVLGLTGRSPISFKQSMLKNFYLMPVLMVLFLGSYAGFLYPQENPSPDNPPSAKEDATPNPDAEKSAEKQTFTIEGVEIPIEKAIELVIKQNLTLRAAKYDLVMTDTGLHKLNKKYAPVVSAEGTYSKQKNPTSGSTVFGGTEMYQMNATASISKLFSTGTLVQLGVTESFFDSNDTALAMNMGMSTVVIKPEDPAYHKPNFSLMIQQELLKNSFGYQDRKEEKMAVNTAKMQRDGLLFELSGLVVSALVDYWQVTIQKEALKNAELELQSARTVRNIIARNIRIGLAERFDLNQYNALVESAEAKVALSRQNHQEAIRKLLRTINMPPETAVEGVTNLVDTLPSMDKDQALATAFTKRVDYKNALLELENAEMEVDKSENGAMPSVSAKFQISSYGQDEQIGPAWGNVGTLTYPAWSAGVKMSYPLWDEGVKTDVRNAHLHVKQAKINLEDMRQEIRDDVTNKLERVRLTHEVLLKSRNARTQSEAYYYLLMQRARQGKFNSVQVKNALDSVTRARQQELESLVQFNISLLQYDLAKNEIFDRYKIDIERIIKEVD